MRLTNSDYRFVRLFYPDVVLWKDYSAGFLGEQRHKAKRKLQKAIAGFIVMTLLFMVLFPVAIGLVMSVLIAPLAWMVNTPHRKAVRIIDKITKHRAKTSQ